MLASSTVPRANRLSLYKGKHCSHYDEKEWKKNAFENIKIVFIDEW